MVRSSAFTRPGAGKLPNRLRSFLVDSPITSSLLIQFSPTFEANCSTLLTSQRIIPPSKRVRLLTRVPLAHPPPLRHACPMIANLDSRSPGSIPNSRCEVVASPVPILRRATPPNRLVPSSGKRPGVLSFALAAPLPAPRTLTSPNTTFHLHDPPVNRTSREQNDPPFTMSSTPEVYISTKPRPFPAHPSQAHRSASPSPSRPAIDSHSPSKPRVFAPVMVDSRTP